MVNMAVALKCQCQQVYKFYTVLTTYSFKPEYSIGTIIPQPHDVRLSHINRHQLTLNWSSVYEDCPALHYNVSATNCGECPSITYSNSATCNITSLILPQVCIVVIRAVVCNHAHEPSSEQLAVALQGLTHHVYKQL